MKTHCKNGHEYTPESSYFAPATGERSCLICRREVSRNRVRPNSPRAFREIPVCGCSEMDLAWAAGIFEGEGTVRIAPVTRSNLSHLGVSITNTDAELLGFFQAHWPGHVRGVSGLGQNRRPAFVWRIYARVGAAFLRDIRPYVKTQRVLEKIALGLAFQDQKSTRGDSRTVEYRERQEEFFLAMKQLNVRGVATCPDAPSFKRKGKS